MRDRPFSMYDHNPGRINGYGSNPSFSGDEEERAVCTFCRAETRLRRGRYAWHNCNGFWCPATDKTPEEAALIEIDDCGRVIHETDETEPAN